MAGDAVSLFGVLTVAALAGVAGMHVLAYPRVAFGLASASIYLGFLLCLRPV